MLDIKLLRTNPQNIEKKLLTKGDSINISQIIDLDEKVRFSLKQVEDLQAKRNTLSKKIGEKKQKKEDASEIMKEVHEIGNTLTQLNTDLKKVQEERDLLLSQLPNIPFDEIPISLDPHDNVCIKTYGEKREFSFPFKNHLELNERLGLFDFKNPQKSPELDGLFIKTKEPKLNGL